MGIYSSESGAKQEKTDEEILASVIPPSPEANWTTKEGLSLIVQERRSVARANRELAEKYKNKPGRESFDMAQNSKRRANEAEEEARMAEEKAKNLE